MKTLPSRAEIPESDRWDLRPLFASTEAWEECFRSFLDRYPRIAQYRGTLGNGPAQLFECLEFRKSLDLQAERLGQYASLQTSEDGANPDYLEREGRLLNALGKAIEVASFVEPEIMAIPDDIFASYLAASELVEWRIYLEKLRRFKPYTLSEVEERLMALAAPVLQGPTDIFGQLTDVDMKFGTITDETGAEVELSHGGYSSFLQKRDRPLRERAFRQYYKEFEEHKHTIAAALAASVKGDVFRARARGYGSALEAALFPDNVPVKVYTSLIEAVRSRLDALHRYYELRRRLLRLPDIHFYDTYVSVVPEMTMRKTFDEAAELVLNSLAPLGADYVNDLRAGFASRWVDRYESKGKRSGAFSSSSYGNPPYILMNYKEDVFADIYTLAHEAGHSMHSLYSQRAQRFQDHRYPIFLAEVASTFNEELLTHYLLETTSDSVMRAFIINRQIDDIRGTVFRQTMFAEFEKIIHEMEENGEALTLETFRSAYRGLLEVYFGKDFCLDDELSLEWLRIPHFYNAFYVYKYATGLSAAVALSRGVIEKQPGAVERYREFLASGGSRDPLETLRSAGVDMESPEPVFETLDLFDRRVRELEHLLSNETTRDLNAKIDSSTPSF